MLWNVLSVFFSKSELEVEVAGPGLVTVLAVVMSLVSSSNDGLKEGCPFSHASPLLLFAKNEFIFWHLLASFLNLFSF